MCPSVRIYLLVVKYYHDGQGRYQYRLSGIAQLDDAIEDASFAVPRDRDAAVLGLPRSRPREGEIESVFLAEDPQMTSYYQGQWPRHLQRCGYPVHVRCWSLIERIIGPDAETHLELLIEALRQQFRKWIDPSPHAEPDGYFSFYLERYEMLTDKTQYLFRDPVQIVAVERLLKNATIKKRRRSPPRRHLKDHAILSPPIGAR
ncbi:hypothetical protein VTN77DRAFT_5152 [Rasamsonia byssochlamydoides]|uniref:uncharacterized protein n=1 Tax=Rasamsonia byssochlamydoides TaxID=89139 RepID=UPI0037425561